MADLFMLSANYHRSPHPVVICESVSSLQLPIALSEDSYRKAACLEERIPTWTEVTAISGPRNISVGSGNRVSVVTNLPRTASQKQCLAGMSVPW